MSPVTAGMRDEVRFAPFFEEAERPARQGHLPEAVKLLDNLVLNKDFPEFLTLQANERLE